jgi:hypothetical protein
MNNRRGDIYLVALDPVMGGEISKTRPVMNDFPFWEAMMPGSYEAAISS